MGRCPVLAKATQKGEGESRVAVLLSLALLDSDDHALAVDVGRAKSDHL